MVIIGLLRLDYEYDIKYVILYQSERVHLYNHLSNYTKVHYATTFVTY